MDLGLKYYLCPEFYSDEMKNEFNNRLRRITNSTSFYLALKRNYLQMKKIIIPALILLLASCSGNKDNGKVDSSVVMNTETANGPVDKSQLPVIKFKETEFNYGRIIQGEKVAHTFSFTNEGKSNLIVVSAKASCGCTVAQPPKDPIPPGGTGKIDVVFDSNNKAGMVSKTITVLTNCEPNTVMLTITGEVVVPATTETK